MSYTIDYLEDIKTVQIRIEGIVNFSTAQQYSEKARKLAHEYSCKKFLFDHVNTVMEAGIYKIHTDGYTLEKFGFHNSDKIAIIVSGNNQKKDNQFSENSDANVKWSNIKYFNTLEQAVNWLVKDEEVD